MSVVFINLFEVAEGRDEAFLELFAGVNAHMSAQPGYQGHRLGRAMLPSAGPRFANVVTWESRDAWQAAHGPEFRALVSDPAWREFPATPGLYDPVHSGGDLR